MLKPVEDGNGAKIGTESFQLCVRCSFQLQWKLKAVNLFLRSLFPFFFSCYLSLPVFGKQGVRDALLDTEGRILGMFPRENMHCL